MNVLQRGYSASHIVICLLVVVAGAWAQSGGTYHVTQSVIAGGGSTSTGGQFSVTATTGQSVAAQKGPGGTAANLGFWTPPDLSPTAATVGIAGRVLTADGTGLRNVVITVTDADGHSRTTRSASFGYYAFDGLPSGATYVVALTAKHFQFAEPTRVINLVDELTNLDFTALP